MHAKTTDLPLQRQLGLWDSISTDISHRGWQEDTGI